MNTGKHDGRKLAKIYDNADIWSAAAWHRFVIDNACSRPKRRQAATLQI
jgi:hypothetical protein